jgi:hypothetical protein
LRHHDMYRRSPGSPDNKNLDVDVRVASLESANRRLQDELRGVVEDNERLRDEVERWRRWDRDMRETRRDDDRVRKMPRYPVAILHFSLISTVQPRRSDFTSPRSQVHGSSNVPFIDLSSRLSACASSPSASGTKSVLHQQHITSTYLSWSPAPAVEAGPC